MNTRKILKDYFSFSKKDRIGIYCVLSLILIIYFLPQFFKNSTSVAIQQDTTLTKLLDTVQQQQQDLSSASNEASTFNLEPTQKNTFTKGTLFAFDPNTLSAEGWKQLGLRERTIKTIINYRNKGGKFYKPEDLQKIWGLPEGFYAYVTNSIHITSINQKNENRSPFPYSSYEKKERRFSTVDINSGDTAAYIALPGIGSKLASRIVNFREKLGGFYSIEQIKETYGLPDSTFQSIKTYLTLNTPVVKKFNLNTVTKEEMKAHPYIRWQLANAIVEYRNQHGPFKNVEEIKNILIIDEATFNKVSPYLSL